MKSSTAMRITAKIAPFVRDVFSVCQTGKFRWLLTFRNNRTCPFQSGKSKVRP